VTEGARELLRMQLIRHEGLRLFPYRDSVGKLTIGVGRNLDDVGVSAVEAYTLLDNDLDRTIGHLVTRYPAWFVGLDDARQAAIINVAFNLGPAKFATFSKAIAALDRGDWLEASSELLVSRWASQVGRRAVELASQVKTGMWAVPFKR
jgi:lysozyme